MFSQVPCDSDRFTLKPRNHCIGLHSGSWDAGHPRIIAIDQFNTSVLRAKHFTFPFHNYKSGGLRDFLTRKQKVWGLM